MGMYKLSFTIDTEADPTILLEMVEHMADIIVETLDEDATYDENSPCVETIGGE
jgi:hypothetical protein